MKQKMTRAMLAFVALCCTIMALGLFSGAQTTVERKGSMIEIEENFSAYRLGDVQRISSDGYIGIPVQLSVYYDGEERVTSGIGGTPLILYVINTATERIGTKTDTQIIRSMLDRGYLVCVVDYLENGKATTPALDWSLQTLRANINAGKYFSGMGIPTSDYKETFVVPAGYDVSLSHSFWEIDKHSVAGTLEYITKVWNTDVRSIFGERVIPWTDAEGERKQVQTAYDGTAPVWLNASGAADENGSYIKIKHTLARTVEDCVKPDGSALDMNLYMHIIYPTAPKNEVPVMCFAASSEHLADAVGTAGRPQMNGFVFSGYAGILMDYGYVPMARADHYKEFSGTAGVTGDNVTYSIAFYNGVKINTAAMRYLRYLGASDEAFAFDAEAIGIYGNSKGGWMMMLGAEHPELLAEQRFFEGHHGETRYEAGEIADSASGLVKGGEAQPWLTYNGEVLDSGADFIYASCGGGEQHIMDGHAPTFVSCNLGDGTFYANSNNFVNYCRNHNVPCLWFEVNKGHTFTYGEDMNFGVDTYDAFFTFANYYLRGDAVSVVYTSFTKKNAEVDPAAAIVIKFSGAVSAEAVQAVTVSAVGGNAVSGTWSSQFGNTEWTFKPSAPLASSTEYVISVPETLAGDNGIAMGEEFAQSFTTAEAMESEVSLVSGTRGGYYTFTVNSEMKAAKKVFLRFAVSCDGTNLAGVYPVSGFSAASPDASLVAASSIGSIPIFGSGVYSCDVAAYVKTLSVGDTAAFLVKMERNVGNSSVFSAPMDTAVQGSLNKASGAIASDISGIEGAGALKLSAFQTNVITGSKESITYYNNTSSVLTISNLIKNGALANADLGRRFTVSFRVYDTVSRKLSVALTGATSSVQGVADYNAVRYNFLTKAGEWTEISFDYTVREPLLGAAGLISKRLGFSADTLGDEGGSYPFYIDTVSVTESASAVSLGAASVAYSTIKVDPAQTPYGLIPEEYADADAYPVAIFAKNGTEWEFKSAGAILPKKYNYGADAVIFLRTDYALSSSAYDLDTIGANRALTIDLGGHTLDITGAGQYNSLSTYAKQNNTSFTLKNGMVYSNGKASLATIYSGGNNTVNLTFENLSIELGMSFGETSALIRHGYHSPANYLATYNITFSDCDIDISACNSSSLYAIRAGYFGGGYQLNWKVNGGSLTTGTSTFYSNNIKMEKGGSLSFGKGKDGSAFRLVTKADLSGTAYYSDLEGEKHYFGAVSTDGTAYAHEPMSLSAPYGAIPADKLSPLAYPILLFVKENGEWKWKNAYSALPTSYGYGKEAVLLLRRDYAMSSAKHDLDTIGASASLTLDLGGHTLDITGAGQYHSFSTQAAQSNTGFTLKNGRIYSNGKASLATIHSGGNNTFRLAFEDLSIELGASFGETSALIRHGYHSPPTYLATYDITFTDCDIDISACNSSSLFAIRVGYFGGGYQLNWKVNGGSLTTGTSTFYSNNIKMEKGGSLSFGKGKDGSDFRLFAAADLSGTAYYSDLSGEKHYFGAISTDGTAYVHEPMSLSTPYGDIPASKLSLLAYPFVAFEDNGDGTYTYKTASANFFTDGGMENTMRSVENAIILLRRDFTVTTRISNLSKRSNLTVDLGGHTLTTAGSSAPIESEAKSGNEVRLTFENGTVLLDTTAFVNFSSYSVAETDYYITFKDIVFRFAEGTKVKSPTTFGLTRVSYFLSLCYEDCTFDLGKHQASGIVLIAANPKVNTQGAGTVTLRSVSVIGGTVKAASIEGIALSDVPSALTYGKSAGGKYLGFDVPIVQDAVLSGGIGLVNWGFGMSEYAPVGVTLSHEGVVVDEVFGYSFAPVTVKNGKNDAQKAITSVKPGMLRMSLTLQSKIGLNLFLSDAIGASAIKLGGVAHALGTAENGYYHLEGAIAPNIANQPVILEIAIGENVHSIPVSVGSYARALLSSSQYADVHALTYSMVEYVRAMTDADFLSDVQAPVGYERKVLEAVPYEAGENTLLSAIRFNLSDTIEIEVAGNLPDGTKVNLILATARSENEEITGGYVRFSDLYINEFCGEMKIKVCNETYFYSLENYLDAMKVSSERAVIEALYNYAFYADLYVKDLQNA